jgi:hypothetical protein
MSLREAALRKSMNANRGTTPPRPASVMLLSSPLTGKTANKRASIGGGLARTPNRAVFTSEKGRVKVFARVRPPGVHELNQLLTVQADTEKGKVLLNVPADSKYDGPREWQFDQVFGTESTQEDIFLNVGKPVVDDVICGYNGCVFAYGQTGSGKTYSMLEVDESNSEKNGLIPRVVEYMFNCTEKMASDYEYSVTMSCLQIHKESIFDLLGGNLRTPLHIREHPESGLYVEELTQYKVRCARDVMELMEKGRGNIVYAETNMNQNSSRSHAVVEIAVERRRKQGPKEKSAVVERGKFQIVDLAGSERQKKSGAEGERFKEAVHINVSLSALGNVINALTDDKQTYIPYRDSQLTRLLQDVLGGNCLASLLVNMGPCLSNLHESVSSLRFGTRAANIRQTPKVNRSFDFEKYSGELQMQLQQLQDELDRTRAESNHQAEKVEQLVEGLRRRYEDAIVAKMGEEVTTASPANGNGNVQRIQSKLRREALAYSYAVHALTLSLLPRVCDRALLRWSPTVGEPACDPALLQCAIRRRMGQLHSKISELAQCAAINQVPEYAIVSLNFLVAREEEEEEEEDRIAAREMELASPGIEDEHGGAEREIALPSLSRVDTDSSAESENEKEPENSSDSEGSFQGIDDDHVQLEFLDMGSDQSGENAGRSDEEAVVIQSGGTAGEEEAAIKETSKRFSVQDAQAISSEMSRLHLVEKEKREKREKRERKALEVDVSTDARSSAASESPISPSVSRVAVRISDITNSALKSPKESSPFAKVEKLLQQMAQNLEQDDGTQQGLEDPNLAERSPESTSPARDAGSGISDDITSAIIYTTIGACNEFEDRVEQCLLGEFDPEDRLALDDLDEAESFAASLGDQNPALADLWVDLSNRIVADLAQQYEQCIAVATDSAGVLTDNIASLPLPVQVKLQHAALSSTNSQLQAALAELEILRARDEDHVHEIETLQLSGKGKRKGKGKKGKGKGCVIQ